MIHVWCLVARHGTKTAWISKVENGGVWRLELCQLYCTKLTNQVCDSVLVLMKNVYHTHTSLDGEYLKTYQKIVCPLVVNNDHWIIVFQVPDLFESANTHKKIHQVHLTPWNTTL